MQAIEITLVSVFISYCEKLRLTVYISITYISITLLMPEEILHLLLRIGKLCVCISEQMI